MPTLPGNTGGSEDAASAGADLSPELREARRLLDQGQEILEGSVSFKPPDAIKECDRALTLFKQARSLAGDHPELGREARLAVASGYSQRGHQQRYAELYTESLADLSQALRLNPANAQDYYYRALSYLSKGDVRQARADLTEYLRRGEDDYLRAMAHRRLAGLVPGKEDSKEILDHWRNEGTRLNSEASNALNPRGEEARPDLAGAVKLFNQAQEAFYKALEASPNDMMTRISLLSSLKQQAEVYRQMEEYDLALANYEQAMQVRPDPNNIFFRAETLLEAGHNELAQAAFREFLEKGKDAALRTQAKNYLAAKPGGARSQDH